MPLIVKRLRELNVYTVVKSYNFPVEEIKKMKPKGIILSGSPYSVYWEDAPLVSEEVFRLGIPVLGVCYGMQLLNFQHGGKVYKMFEQELGKAEVTLDTSCSLFKGIAPKQKVWMMHGDNVHRDGIGEGFKIVGNSGGNVTAISDEKRKLYGVQFHPEINVSNNEIKIFDNFVNICGCKKEWKIEKYVEEVKAYVKKTVGNNKVLILVSGSVDSAVASVLMAQTLPVENIHVFHVNTGLMRKHESRLIEESLRKAGLKNLHIIDASSEYFEALRGVIDNEEKRKVMGKVFIKIQEREIKRLGLDGDDVFLCQGTLYHDVLERNRANVSSRKHHEFSSPLVIKKRMQKKIVEPNTELFREDVKKLGRMLSLPEKFLSRHSFPGSGLATRIIGEVTEERADLLKEVDDLFIQELKNEKIYEELWHAFCVLLPVNVRGMKDQVHIDGNAVVLRAVTTIDGIRADWYQMDTKVIDRISRKITSNVKGITRVVYDVTSKPPGTIEWD